MRVGHGLALLVVLAAMLAGTAGLTTLRGESWCQAAWPLQEGGPTYEERSSLWPPGMRCLLVDVRSGAILDEETPPYALGFVLLVLELALLALVLRARPHPSLALRAAAVAAAAVLVWGLVNLEIGFPANWMGSLTIFGPLAGFLVDRRLRRLRPTDRRWFDGALGLLIAPAALVLDLFAWILLGVLGHAVTVAIVAVAALAAERLRRTGARGAGRPRPSRSGYVAGHR